MGRQSSGLLLRIENADVRRFLARVVSRRCARRSPSGSASGQRSRSRVPENPRPFGGSCERAHRRPGTSRPGPRLRSGRRCLARLSNYSAICAGFTTNSAWSLCFAHHSFHFWIFSGVVSAPGCRGGFFTIYPKTPTTQD
jgi:hypothetical protein